MRIPQPTGTKGSLKWMQRSVQFTPQLLQPKALHMLDWVSPLAEDAFAEYRDASFLTRVGLDQLRGELEKFWPRRGPQWDGLARFQGGVVLAEAKAHLPEFNSAPSAASAKSLQMIKDSFDLVQADLGISPRAWHRHYYQYANRLSHLWWLRKHQVDAHLLFISFVGDVDLDGPQNAQEWKDAYSKANKLLGVNEAMPIMQNVHHVYPDIRALAEG